jgi:hypothetical protein
MHTLKKRENHNTDRSLELKFYQTAWPLHIINIVVSISANVYKENYSKYYIRSEIGRCISV